MQEIEYRVGDVLWHKSNNPVIIPHVCNSVGAWGSGFVVAISRHDPFPEEAYRKWYKTGLSADKIPFALGNVQFVAFNSKWVRNPARVVIANMIAQEGIGFHNGKAPIRYDAVKQSLIKVREAALELKAEIAAPKFGSGLAGGKWPRIEQIIVKELCKHNLKVYIYDL